MRAFIRIISACVCLMLLDVSVCDDVKSKQFSVDETIAPKTDTQVVQKKESRTTTLAGSNRRATPASTANVTRDSQLLSVLAARRRQLLNGRLAAHINTLATIAHKPHKSNTTFAQLEVRDANNSLVKRITFDNSSNELTPTLKLITTDGSKEVRRDLKPHEIKHLFIPKIYQDTKFRTTKNDAIYNNTSVEEYSTDNIIFVPPETVEEKESILEPDEEFQVDESNHGLYLLNYTEPENVTSLQSVVNDVKNNTKLNQTNLTKINEVEKNKSIDNSIILKKQSESKDNVQNTTTLNVSSNPKVEPEKDKENKTLFMSDELYNHFRPLESELPLEEMAPFLYFGQKLGGQNSDNLTYSPILSASTKSINFVVAPSERKRHNSRYSATEKYTNTSVDEEEELNENMDVSVVKNTIEKNKIRNSIKGLAPPRHVGLVNAYRKQSSSTAPTSKPLNFAQLNVTEPIVYNVVLSTTDKMLTPNKTYGTQTVKNETVTNKDLRQNNSSGRNHTRNYSSIRRRPSRLTTLTTTESILPNQMSNSSVEKTSTPLYTAVVTSVSITSSMKGQNKTDDFIKDTNNKTQLVKTVTKNSSDSGNTTTLAVHKPYRHRIRIRTTTTERNQNFSSTQSYLDSLRNVTDSNDYQLNKKLNDNERENDIIIKAKTSQIKDMITSTSKPKTLKRRRPTTTSTTVSSKTLYFYIPNTTNPINTEKYLESTEKATNNFITTTDYSSERAPIVKSFVPHYQNNITNLTKLDKSNDDSFKFNSHNEEVLIEVEKSNMTSFILAGLGLLPIAAIVAFSLRNIRGKKIKELDTDYEGYFEDSDIKKETSITPVARPPMPTLNKPDQKWEFPRNKLRLQTLLGQGNFGQVWKAEADDLNGHDGLTRLVAVKSIKETASQKEKQELLHEISIMQKIGPHPNVVTLLGCCTEQEPYLLIMEYVMCGKLLTYLRERRSRPDRFGGSGALTSRDLTVFAYCIARGMDYIASKGIVHRDLAARNVLVDHNKLCKIADFGMSRSAGSNGRGGARHALPVRWMAPEALLYSRHTHQADVWAFGIVLWEIVTLGSTPYATMSGREVLTAVTEGYRLERPPHCKPQLYRAMHDCWNADPSLRPTFSQLKAQLAELLDNEPSEGNYVDLDSFYQDSSVYSDPSAIINDDEGLSSEYDRERRCFRELNPAPVKYDNRGFDFHEDDFRGQFGNRMAFGVRDRSFNERNFSDGEFDSRCFADKNFNDCHFAEKNFSDRQFPEDDFNMTPNRKDGNLSSSSFHKGRERENPLVSRNSFNGFPRITTNRDGHFQIMTEGRNKRVPEFECDI